MRSAVTAPATTPPPPSSGAPENPTSTPAPDTLRSMPTLPMISSLAVAMIIGYEWFISGLVKVVRGDFPAGLGEELVTKSEGSPSWYSSFLTDVAIPNAEVFGYFIEIAELLAGIALIIGPLIWIFAWDRISDNARGAVLLAIAVAAIGGAILAINLHLANGAGHPWLIPGDSFDEGIDLDSILPAIQVVIATVSVILLARLWRTRSNNHVHSPEVTTIAGTALSEGTKP